MLEALISWRFAVKSVAWGAAMWAALEIRHLSGSWSHALCGPWGCGPTLESVVACHVVWIVLLMPAVLVLFRWFDRDALALCGRAIAAVGLLGLMGVAVWLATSWYPSVGDLQRSYPWQKYLYTVACLVDVPLVQLVLVGLVLQVGGRWRGHKDAPAMSSAAAFGHLDSSPHAIRVLPESDRDLEDRPTF